MMMKKTLNPTIELDLAYANLLEWVRKAMNLMLAVKMMVLGMVAYFLKVTDDLLVNVHC